jgi:predicted XRE-type DNA-binding protein
MKTTRGSGNVFLDVGFSPEAAENLQLRADLMIVLTDLIKKRRWTQAVAAKAMGVTQPRISDLKRGKLTRFSLDMLIQMLNRAGAHVTIKIDTRRAHRSRFQAALYL